MAKSVLEGKEDLLDIKGLAFFVLSRWYFFVVSLVIAYIISNLYLRYQDPIYNVNSSLLIKMDGNSFEKSLGGLDISNGDNNLTNQINILKSFDLSFKTLLNLDFFVSFHHKGDVRTVELYDDKPFIVKLDSSHLQMVEAPYYVAFLPNNKFRITTKGTVFAKPYNIISHQVHASPVQYKLDTILTWGVPYQDTHSAFTLYLTDPNSKHVDADSDDPSLYFIMHDLSILAHAYKSKIQVAVDDKKGSILILGLSGPVANKNINFLNKLCEVYIQNSLDEKNENIISILNFIESQLEEITEALSNTESEKEIFLRTQKSMNFQNSASTVVQKLEGFDREKGILQLHIRYLNYLKDYLNNNKDLSELVVPSSMGIVDPVLGSLINNLVKIQTDRASVGQLSSDKNPYILNLDRQFEFAKRGAIEGINALITQNEISMQDLESKIVLLEKKLSSLPTEERRLTEINRRFTLNDHLYNFLLEKRSEAGISRAANRADHKVVEKAGILGSVQVAPNTNSIKNSALLLGFFLPLIIILTFYFMNDRIIKKEMIGLLTSVPVLGSVSHNEFMESHLLAADHPKSTVAESLRSLRINLKYIAPDLNTKVIAISSSVSGEGKSFISVNLASIFALTGKKVLLIGADMRKPNAFGGIVLKNQLGLSSILSNQSEIEGIIIETQIPEFNVLPSGPVPPNPSELLALAKFGTMLEKLKKSYDIIILDTPPIGLVSDAQLVFDSTDINIFVVRQNYTTKEMLTNLNEKIQNTPNIKNPLIVFNDIKIGLNNYSYKYGRGYYEDNNKSKLPWLQQITKLLKI